MFTKHSSGNDKWAIGVQRKDQAKDTNSAVILYWWHLNPGGWMRPPSE